VDTGGTYTDAVLLDAETRLVRASAKALTTRGDLAIGVSNALAAISDGLDPAAVRLVSVSTTLATNAVVEGHGSPVLAILVGFDDAMVERSGIGSAFGDVIIARVSGGHDHHGMEREPLDTEAIDELLAKHAGSVRAVAVASAFAVRNTAHEDHVCAAVSDGTDLPITASSALSESLDAPRRALTTVLNARLLSRIADLVAAVGRSLDQLGIDAPMTVAKGDGSLAVADAVARRPIETILSGPAASMVGAGVLSGRATFLLSDIGGTTTDVGRLSNGRPHLAPDGAKVGGWRTMVRAIDVRTTGLGGDSEVVTDRTDITVGPQRRVPVSLVGSAFPSVLTSLARDLDDPSSRETAAQFVVLPEGASLPTGELSRVETRVLERLGSEPASVRDVAPGAVDRRTLHTMAERGWVQLVGFTPSDAAHVLGLQENWSRSTAEAGARLMAWYTGEDPVEFCRRVWSETVRRSAAAVLEVAFDDRLGDPAVNQLASAAIDGVGQLGGVSVALSPMDPIVAVGGPAGVYYDEVASRLSAELILPERFEVANAVGAAAGELIVSGTAEVHTDGPGLFRIISSTGTETSADGSDALRVATERATTLAEAALAEAATGLSPSSEATVTVDVERHDAPDALGDTGLYFARVTAEARSLPY
jgi:N-methylhydantoinase A/oxoprolinase/acetone carboxylase beta subunit